MNTSRRINPDAVSLSEQPRANHVEDYSMYHVNYRLISTGGCLYGGLYSSSMGELLRPAGKSEEPLGDRDVARFVQQAGALSMVATLWVARNVISVGVSRDTYNEWPEAAPVLREPVAELALARFPDRSAVEFVERPPALIGSPQG